MTQDSPDDAFYRVFGSLYKEPIEGWLVDPSTLLSIDRMFPPPSVPSVGFSAPPLTKSITGGIHGPTAPATTATTLDDDDSIDSKIQNSNAMLSKLRSMIPKQKVAVENNGGEGEGGRLGAGLIATRTREEGAARHATTSRPLNAPDITTLAGTSAAVTQTLKRPASLSSASISGSGSTGLTMIPLTSYPRPSSSAGPSPAVSTAVPASLGEGSSSSSTIPPASAIPRVGSASGTSKLRTPTMTARKRPTAGV